jgi:glycyl-tRNA synthetase beta chain
VDQGVVHDTFLAVTLGFPDVVDVAARARALQRVRSDPVMPRLATAFARASRILVQGGAAPEVDESLLKEPAEVNLFRTLRDVGSEIAQTRRARDPARMAGAALEELYVDVLKILERFADPIDRFFDDVLVMAPDVAVRANRLALLRDVTLLFLVVADFSKLSG